MNKISICHFKSYLIASNSACGLSLPLIHKSKVVFNWIFGLIRRQVASNRLCPNFIFFKIFFFVKFSILFRNGPWGTEIFFFLSMYSFRDRDSGRYWPLRRRQHGNLKWPISTAPEHSKVYNCCIKSKYVNIVNIVNIVKRWKQLVSSF